MMTKPGMKRLRYHVYKINGVVRCIYATKYQPTCGGVVAINGYNWLYFDKHMDRDT